MVSVLQQGAPKKSRLLLPLFSAFFFAFTHEFLLFVRIISATLRASTSPVGLWRTLCTDPPLPKPSKDMGSKSSFRSSRTLKSALILAKSSFFTSPSLCTGPSSSSCMFCARCVTGGGVVLQCHWIWVKWWMKKRERRARVCRWRRGERERKDCTILWKNQEDYKITGEHSMISDYRGLVARASVAKQQYNVDICEDIYLHG